MAARRRSGGRSSAGILAWLLCSLLLAPTSALAWWNADWPYRTRITLDAGPNGAAIAEPIGRTAVLVRLHAGNLNFADLQEDGSDLRFVAGDDKTPLRFHIEKFDGLIEQVGLVWVDVPDLAPGAATAIYMYYGNAEAQPASDPKATYDAEQALVYHFGGEAGPPRDQTRNGNDALDPVERDEAGIIGFGARFSGGAAVRLPDTPSLAIAAGQPLTWQAWVKLPDAGSGVLYAAGGPAAGFAIGFDRGRPFAEADGPAGVVRTPLGAELPASTWRHLAVTASDRIVVWVDGAPYAEAQASLPAIAGGAVIGGPRPAPAPAVPAVGTPAPSPGGGFVGEIDELQIARALRPAGAIQLAARSQGLDARLVTLDVAEQSGGGSGYLHILLRSLTFDGWVVIVLCTVMAIVCAFIIVGKAIYLGRLGSANRLFREEFAKSLSDRGLHAGAAATGLSEQRLPALGHSSLYRLYRLSLDEVSRRIGDGGTAATAGLRPESLVAIRAALDSGLLRETQRMSAQMVMLTIAISGGPFLGLLGTVIGVMVTFAAVAAAGDVNINAIAPGIAAALLATVAGLAVAIPALFGYNWLLTRIKEQSAQMQLFVNELQARIAEAYPSGR